MTFNSKHIISLIAACIVLASCGITKKYNPPVIPDAAFRDMAADSGSMASLKWNEIFADTILQRLIAEGIANSPELNMAFARVEEARAYFQQSRAAFWPTLNGNATVTESKLSEAQGFGIRTHATQYQIGLSSSWEIDVWGKLRSNKRASLASLFRSDAAVRTVQTGLVATIAAYYYQLMALDQQLLITEKTIHYWDTTVVTMRALKEPARVTEAAVVQSEAQGYAAAVTIPDLKQAIRETENALSILLGDGPRTIPRSRLAEQRVIDDIKTGVPAELLANRPDVQEAEFAFRYAFELTNVARAQFYPSLSITGSAGFNSLSFASLFDPASLVASIAAGLTQPVFNQRVNRTRLEVSRAQQREAFYNFQNRVLVASKEVSDAVALYENALDKIAIRGDQIRALELSVSYSHELLQYGFANYTEVIQARQSLLAAELGSVNDQLQKLQATVSLYRALGGGWR